MFADWQTNGRAFRVFWNAVAARSAAPARVGNASVSAREGRCYLDHLARLRLALARRKESKSLVDLDARADVNHQAAVVKSYSRQLDPEVVALTVDAIDLHHPAPRSDLESLVVERQVPPVCEARRGAVALRRGSVSDHLSCPLPENNTYQVPRVAAL